jgi:NAD(P)-dependent dehydrogenase (short-subunit alcohol dehydrogenase family)
MTGRLESKTAVITGGASGIGAEMARLFAAEGARVAVADIADAPESEAIVSIPTDVSDAAQVDRLFARVQELFGGLDILVNNAFHSRGDATIADLEEAVFDQIVAVCLKGPYLCTRRALPLMKARGGGSIVSISSVNALFGFGETAYTAAKGGLISMMRLVAAEYGEWNIRSNVICPGTIATEASMSHWRKYPRGYEKLLDMYPLGRIGEPREVAAMALFLASAEASFVNGAVHIVDGGLLAGRKFED